VKPRINYIPGTTPIHNLHPLIKAAWLLALTGLVFLFHHPGINLLFTMLVIVSFPLLGIKLTRLRGVKVLVATALMIALLQIVFSDGGEIITRIGPVTVSAAGIDRGIYLGTRFLLVILLSYLFVLTTSPTDLAYALMQAGLPYRFGFTFVTALRMIPLFEEETMIVFRAQRLRGVSYRGRSIRKLLQSVKSFLLPMLVSALSKVDALSISMEGRCYGKYPTRTYYKIRKITPGDIYAGAGLVVSVAVILVIRIWES